MSKPTDEERLREYGLLDKAEEVLDIAITELSTPGLPKWVFGDQGTPEGRKQDAKDSN